MNIETHTQQLISTLKRLLYKSEEFVLFDILNNSKPSLTFITSNFNNEYYSLILECDMDYFSEKYGSNILREAEEDIIGYMSDILRGEPQQISEVVIKPLIKDYINWDDIADIYTKDSLILDIENLKQLLLDASTGVKIETINEQYILIFNKTNQALNKLNIENPNPYKNLWEAYQYWSTNLPTYAERRLYFSNLFSKLITILKESDEYSTLSLPLEYTGWQELDRKIAEMKKQFKEAQNEEQFNGIGAICRSTYISLANKVFNPTIHKTVDGIIPSETDYKRKLEAFINFKLSGSTNENFRSYSKKTMNLADELTHKTTANRVQTALTITSLISVVNIIKILDESTLKF